MADSEKVSSLPAQVVPQHEHDCDVCVFLGRWGEYDLYFHEDKKEPVLTTVVARFGPDEDYASGLTFATSDRALTEARRRAKEYGYGDAIKAALGEQQ